MKKIGILGSTGSVGSQALEIIKSNPDIFDLIFISGFKNAEKLEEQIKIFKPKYACLSNESSDKNNLTNINKTVKILNGNDNLNSLCDLDVDLILNSISGYKGLYLSEKIINNGIDIALSNKECIVQAGEILTNLAKKNNVNIFPVDSEHSAIWQSLCGENNKNIKRLILTGSGGPFRKLNKEKFKDILKKDALKHPNWNMGDKITIDSATMMNKGFEVIEAHWLFNIKYDNIDIVVHPESIIHSMVEFIDGSIKAQLSIPTMTIPIQYALTYPNRIMNNDISFDFLQNNSFTFEKVDLNKFKCIKLAYEAGKAGGTYPTVLNVSNDLAVELFLNEKINFNDIEKIIEKALDSHNNISSPNMEDIKNTVKLTETFIEDLKIC